MATFAVLVLACTAGLFVSCDGAHILAVLPTPSHSHGIWNRAFVEELAARGHSVVALTPDPGVTSTNLRYIDLEDSYAPYTGEIEGDMTTYSAQQNTRSFFEWAIYSCIQQLKTQGVKTVFNMSDNFDLIIFEAVGNECFLGLISRFKAPIVAVTAYGYAAWNCDVMGIPEPTAVYPQMVLPYSTPMTFWNRVENTVLTWYTRYLRKFEYLPRHEMLAREAFGDVIPPLAEVEANVSLFLVNSGPTGVDQARAIPPSVIEVGCLHCRQGNPLPKDLQEFLDGATQGAVFFSIGSNIPSTWMSSEKRQAFMDAFSELPQRVLWKWESDTMPGQPKNVKLGKWLPQQDILAHPNLRLFVTHGGRLSSQEAAYHGVPVLAVPIFMDQHVNAQRAVDKGIGLKLEFAKVTKTKLSEKLSILLRDNTFRLAARAQAAISRDQPETPLDRAVFWTEYVIRHKGAPHLRSAALDLAWYQLYLLDVAAAILVTLLVTILALRGALRLCCGGANKNNNNSSEINKAKKNK